MIQMEQGLKTKMLEDLNRRIQRIEDRRLMGKWVPFFWWRTRRLLNRLHDVKMK
jgi:ABC-type antimicrobial peptide transport system ATPase subunit